MRHLVLLSMVCFIKLNAQVKQIALPEMKPVQVKQIAQLDTLIHKETSGIVKSNIYDGVYWVHNDSGDTPRLIPINRKGEIAQAYRYKSNEGQFIGDAVNMDWEEIMKDDKGNIIVADFGNNCNCRRDLVFYFIRETDPIQRNNRVFKKVFFEYPDQKQFGTQGDDYNFDAEGAFFANGKIYVLSKNRSNTYTKLYRLDNYNPNEVNTLTLVDTFDIKGKVTGADVSKDGKTLAVLTYTAIWLFKAKNRDDYFDGDVSWLPIEASGMEGICFDDEETLLLSREPTGTLHELKISELKKVR
ncbi:MAG: hypothetical protein AAGH46_01905 [Bacteroidota bacterium]|nr:hypothetical protein [uncultured Allomuricauda sp.]